jgi:hypothetical protein
MMAGHYGLNSTTSLQGRQLGRLEIVWERLSAANPLLPGMAATTEKEPCCRAPPREGPAADCALQIESMRLQF